MNSFFEDNNVSDEMKAKMLLAIIKSQKATTLPEMEKALLFLLDITRECIALEKQDE